MASRVHKENTPLINPTPIKNKKEKKEKLIIGECSKKSFYELSRQNKQKIILGNPDCSAPKQ